MASLDPDQIKMLEVQHVLSNSIETLWRCATAVDEPSAERQSQMQTDLSELIRQFQALNELSQQFRTDVLIPGDVFARLEAEQNPDLVTRDHLAFARERNDATRGRVLATRALRDTMLAGIEALNITPTLPPAEQQENVQSAESSDHSKGDSMQ